MLMQLRQNREALQWLLESYSLFRSHAVDIKVRSNNTLHRIKLLVDYMLPLSLITWLCGLSGWSWSSWFTVIASSDWLFSCLFLLFFVSFSLLFLSLLSLFYRPRQGLRSEVLILISIVPCESGIVGICV